MTQTTNQRVAAYLTDLQSLAKGRYEIVSAIRELFLSLAPNLVESIKYGGIVYQRDGELVAGIFAYKNHVSLELSHGAQLDDKYSILEGKGKYRRHIKLYTVDDIETKFTQFYIQAVLAAVS